MSESLRRYLEDLICDNCNYVEKCDSNDQSTDCNAFKLLLKLLAPLFEWGLIEIEGAE